MCRIEQLLSISLAWRRHMVLQLPFMVLPKQMSSADDLTANFNVTRKFDVDPGFQYHVRFDYRDIVRNVSTQLNYDVYINSRIASRDLVLSTLTTTALAAAVLSMLSQRQSSAIISLLVLAH
ncbi:hypothetical protein Nepgr_000113 [Nepenthes gracilis]|uniref:Uncharacterized protein n=1 Tax=Nepenthes gracilis TaxID=150966 RepID=A0AAD3P2K5_NEPGR|nr:hypothetical protein Nepgr_000113 [Nepenthes gracilis]